MALTGESKYKILYNSFLTNTKNYSEFINVSCIDMYNQSGNGVLEETFKQVSYEWGNIMNVGMNIVGVPNEGIKRFDEKYLILKNSITAETTSLQKQLPPEATTPDKEYVKKVLLKHAKKSWESKRRFLLQILIELRDRQISLTQSVDKLNLTSNLMGGFLTGTSANGLVNFDITSGTSINNLRSDVANVANKLEIFCSNIKSATSLKYINKLSYPNEYLFFVDKLMDTEIIRYMDSHKDYMNAEKLVLYRDNELINELTKKRTKYKGGISKDIMNNYRRNILKFAITLLNYDVSRYKEYFKFNMLPEKLEQIKSIPKSKHNYEVNFTPNNSELSLVRNFFTTTVMGTNNKSYNSKIIKNITIT